MYRDQPAKGQSYRAERLRPPRHVTTRPRSFQYRGRTINTHDAGALQCRGQQQIARRGWLHIASLARDLRTARGCAPNRRTVGESAARSDLWKGQLRIVAASTMGPKTHRRRLLGRERETRYGCSSKVLASCLSFLYSPHIPPQFRLASLCRDGIPNMVCAGCVDTAHISENTDTASAMTAADFFCETRFGRTSHAA